MADQVFAVNSGFYDAVNSDRTYSADDMNRPYKRVVSNGVFATPKGTKSTDLQVVSANNRMQIIVKKGEGIFADKWFENPAAINITVPANTSTVPRIDSVIVQVDKRTSGRVGNIVYRTGTPSVNPTAPSINTVSNVTEYRLANVRVETGTTAITTAMITDRRGSSDCPWVTSLIYQVDTSVLYDQWAAAYEEYFEAEKEMWDDWYSHLTEELDVSMTLIKHTSTFVTTQETSEITIGISDFNAETDMLEVYINGMRAIEGSQYTISGNTSIILSAPLGVGQTVNFVCLKSVIMGNPDDITHVIEALEERIASITGGVPTVVSSASAMTDTDKIYILTTDSKWYYYNLTSSAWVAGGVYGGVPTDGTLTQSGMAADAKVVGDQFNIINTALFVGSVTYSILNNESITLRNSDILADVQAGDKIILSCTTNGNIVSFGLNEDTAYSSDPTKYKAIHPNSTSDLSNFEFDVDSGTWKSIHIWQSQANTSGIVVTIDVVRPKDRMDVMDEAIENIENVTDELQDDINTINDSLYDTLTYSIVDGTITNRNTDIVCDFQTGDILKVSLTPNGNTVTLALCVGTSFVDDPTKYVVLYNGSGALSDSEFSVSGEYKCLHIWHSTSTAINLTADRIRNQFITEAINADINALMKTRGRNFACFGDSITSEQVTGVGTAVSGLLECDLTGNFACGYAVCSNWHNGSTDTSPISLVTPQNTNTADNVLMNQVLRCLQYTTAEGAQIKWTHPIAGEQSIATSCGTGLGHTDMYPDILYIAIGINDGNNSQNAFVDDADTVMATSYANLTKCSLASALRWAIETLQSAYPDAQVFVASPLFTTSNDATNNGQKSRGAVIAKRECIKKIANYCNAVFVDSTYESGYTVMAANVVGDLHPNARYKAIISRYVANEIRNRLCIAE